MCYSYKTNYKLLGKSSSFTHHNYNCCVPSTCCTDNINAIAEFVPKASESVFCHRLYCSRDSVCELIQVSG